MGRTLAEKIWDDHVVRTGSTDNGGEPDLLYIDLHLIHEVTSPQAFDGLRLGGCVRGGQDARDSDGKGGRGGCEVLHGFLAGSRMSPLLYTKQPVGSYSEA